MQSEYRHLIDVERQDVIEQLTLARSQGDLSENADYDAARERQAQIEGRIQEIEAIFNNAIMVTHAVGDRISIGNIVEFQKEDGSKVTVRIAGNTGADPTAEPPAVSNESPIGKALLGQKVGSQIRVECAEPFNAVITDVSVAK